MMPCARSSRSSSVVYLNQTPTPDTFVVHFAIVKAALCAVVGFVKLKDIMEDLFLANEKDPLLREDYDGII